MYILLVLLVAASSLARGRGLTGGLGLLFLLAALGDLLDGLLHHLNSNGNGNGNSNNNNDINSTGNGNSNNDSNVNNNFQY